MALHTVGKSLAILTTLQGFAGAGTLAEASWVQAGKIRRNSCGRIWIQANSCNGQLHRARRWSSASARLPFFQQTAGAPMAAPSAPVSAAAGGGGGGGDGASVEADVVKNPSVQLLEENNPEFWTRIQAHQKEVARLPTSEEAQTLVARCSRGVLSTLSQKYGGNPFGSLVTYATDDRGRPLLAISSLSPHTADLTAQPKCSLLISKDIRVQSAPVLVVIGTAQFINDDERPGVREAYLKQHPDAFWVDFGDFSFVRIQPSLVRLTAGVATFAVGASVSELTAEEYEDSTADPIAPFEAKICEHMNDDHVSAIVAMAEHQLGVKIPSAKMLQVDRKGFVIEVPFQSELARIRLAFPRPAESRKDVKDLLVEMTRAAARRGSSS